MPADGLHLVERGGASAPNGTILRVFRTLCDARVGGLDSPSRAAGCRRAGQARRRRRDPAEGAEPDARLPRHAEPAFDAAGCFRTGDLAPRHDDGFYEIVGRSKELIISGGENIHPAEIENLVAGFPGVAECALVGLPDAQWGEVPVLVLVPRTGGTLDHTALQRLFDAELARFKHPRRICQRIVGQIGLPTPPPPLPAPA